MKNPIMSTIGNYMYISKRLLGIDYLLIINMFLIVKYL